MKALNDRIDLNDTKIDHMYDWSASKLYSLDYRLAYLLM